MATLTLRPNADGYENQWVIYPSTPTTHYDKVDEETSDGDSTYVTSYTAATRDFWNLQDHTTEVGVINKVTLNLRCRKVINDAVCRFCWYSGTTPYNDSTFALTSTEYALFSKERTANPITGVAWTWNDIDGLQVGILNTGIEYVRCTQAYIVVDYTPGVSYYQTVEEILGMVDAVVPTSGLKQSITEQLGMVDSVAKRADLKTAIIDLLGLLDSSVAPGTLHLIVTEKLGMLDSAAAAKHVYLIISEILGMVDAVVAKGTLHKVVSEILGMLDSAVTVKVKPIIISEILGLKDLMETRRRKGKIGDLPDHTITGGAP